MVEYNQTSEDRFVKTTINLRSKMMANVHERMIELSKEDFIDYLRDLIRLDINHKILGTYDPICLKEFRDYIGFPRKETAKEAIDRIIKARAPRPYGGPPKKFPGFITGERGRNYWPVLQWCRKRAEQWRLEQSR